MKPEELGVITAQQCFAESSLNREGKLSYEAFREWYSKPGPTQLVGQRLPGAAALDGSSRPSVSPNMTTAGQPNRFASLDLAKMREATGLSALRADDLFSIFSSSVRDAGVLTRDAFKQTFFTILRKQKRAPTREIGRFLDRLFTTFDASDDGTVDYIELCSGLSVLCGGSSEEKVAAAFSLFDADGDGFITPKEMESYLASVFSVMYQADTAIAAQPGMIDARSLAHYTMLQAFADADKNHDGKLSFEEFRRWYSPPNMLAHQQAVNGSAPSPPTHAALNHTQTLSAIDFVGSITGLRDRTPSDVFEFIAAKVNDDGVLSRDGFFAVFDEVIRDNNGKNRRQMTPQDKAELKRVLDKLFDEFDTDHDGFVDFCELSSGISILCGGSQDDKIKAAFALFDINQDGFISREEMETYLASVFRTVFATSPATSQQFHNVTPEQLAQITTADAFAVADHNNDGRLSFDEFTKWYASQGGMMQSHPAPTTQQQAPAKSQPPRRMISGTSRGALQEMKDLTNLGSYDVNDIFEFFQASADKDGNVTQAVFFRCFNKLLAKEGSVDRSMQAKTQHLLQELFDLFDTDRNGTIDVHELGAGLSILCGGKVEDKAQSLFTLYDIDKNGFISPQEMNAYLSSVFKVMYKASPELYTQTQLTPEQLAQATTQECFQLFDHNGDGQLSLEEFREWFHRQHPRATSQASANSSSAPVASNGSNAPASGSASTTAARPEPIPIEVAKKLSGLKSVPLEKAMEVFANAMDEDGQISRQRFDACFYQYLCANMSAELTAAESTRVHEVIDRLFAAFDTDHNGFVDFNELSSGLSILCGGGNRDAKVQAAFDLYDTNGDGLISEEDMAHYLGSVFKLLYALDPSREQELGISAEELASVTAGEVFAIADTNKDGKLTFDEFQKWYSQPEQASFNEIVAPLDLNEVRQLTNLGNLDVVEVFERFAEHADSQGLLNHEAFDKCFFEIVGMAAHPRTQIEKLRAKVVADRLFDVFDRDGNGQIDFSELAGGLSVLCKGARDAKVRAAFSLYDFNGDGFISLDEMKRYLTSIFKVLYEVQPGMRQETGVSAEELGSVTAEQAFLEADVNRDGKLSYDEFLTWYNSPAQAGISSAVAKNAIVDSSLRWMPLNEIKQLTNLAQYEPEEVFEIFAAEADQNGLLSRSAFNESFRKIIDGDSDAAADGLANGESAKSVLRTNASKEKIQRVVNDLFDLFDTDHSGSVDFGELASGLSVLCGGTKEQKVQAAFSLFDFNGDGYISLEEMTRYLTSVFRVLFQVSPDTQSLGVSPEELGQVTAQQAFAEADEDHDGRLTLEEFQKWYQQPGGIGEVAKNGEQLFSLAEARRLTNLEAFSPMQVFEALADCADEQGYVSRAAFDECFRKMIAANDGLRAEHQYEHIDAILNRLFELFDVDKNGLVDFSELSSGLSVFCGGTSEEKVRAAFALYDYNGDGYISQDEMARYLTSVFKVLKEASPALLFGSSKAEIADGDGEHLPRESPEELGVRTAQQAFREADVDRDGRLSFDEFRAWYTKSSAANIERLIQNNLPEWLSLREVRRLTNLGAFSADQVLDVFAKFASPTTRTIDRDAFRRAVDQFKASATNASSDASDRLRLLVDRLFDLFDKDKNGVVDFAELASGVSVLCGGSAHDKVRAAFNLYDVNHDGFVSLGEMRLYLTSVFKVLFDVHPDSATRMGVSAEELATITAEQAFAEADLDKDGKLSFEEFSRWYMSSSGGPSAASSVASSSSAASTPHLSPSRVPDWVSLQVVKELTRLENHPPAEVFELFASHCSEDGTISRDAFEVCFEQLMDEEFKNDATRLARVRLVLDRLFDIFDSDGNGVVDFCELTSGLSVLCGGSREDKVRSAFALYDLNQDGFIALEEMTRYLTSVFKVLYETSPDTRAKLGVSAEELAVVTAEQCFVEADLNRDGKLSFDEFVKWYSKSGAFGGDAAVAPLAAESGRALVGSLVPLPVNYNQVEDDSDDNEEEEEKELEQPLGSPRKTVWGTGAAASAPTSSAPASSPPATHDADDDEDGTFPSAKIYGFAAPNGDSLLSPSSASALNMNSSNMDRVRHLLKLDSYEVNDVFEIFAEAAPSGELSFASFKKCFDQIIRLAGGHASLDEKQEADAMVRRLFKVFDTDNSNTVDFGELASGLSVLSGSSMDDKVRAAFQLYDINGDGFITQEEMINYMTSIFRVMYETSDNTKTKMGVSPEELARVTAAQCFKEADLNHDNKLSFDEFKKVTWPLLALWEG